MSGDPYPGIVAALFPAARLMAVERLAGGVSADVHRLDLRLADGSTASVVLRAHGASHAGHPVELEYRLLQSLHRAGVPVPEPLVVDATGRLLGDPFLIMAFVDGTSTFPAAQEPLHVERMAETLRQVHAVPTADLPTLPTRLDPLPEVFDYLPDGPGWAGLRAHLESLTDTAYQQSPKLLHGDFWPENLLWRDGAIVAILDWEDAAIGDPLSDVACSRVELRYKFGKAVMEPFTAAYARPGTVDRQRLALWQVYVAAAAQRFMGDWGLPKAQEAHMRREALASIREAGAELMGRRKR